MNELEQKLQQLLQTSLSVPDADQLLTFNAHLQGLLASITLNPTGDVPSLLINTESISALTLEAGAPLQFHKVFEHFKQCANVLNSSAKILTDEVKMQLSESIQDLTDQGYLNEHLTEKFKNPVNRIFLDKALHNAQTPWQMALVGNWALNNEGIKKFSESSWNKFHPEIKLSMLIDQLNRKISFEHIPSLRSYRKDAMRHYPRLTKDEFNKLNSDQWQEVIDLPSGRPAEHDIPMITAFMKQGDIEHSLYRHFLMPDLLGFLRTNIPERSNSFDLKDADRNILFSLPIVIQQVEDELFKHLKKILARHIHGWAQHCESQNQTEASDALKIASKIWGYRRTAAARECTNPVDNLIKGFTATIRNAFGHFADVNFAATFGSELDVLEVAEKFVLFASVSNGQLDNLATAHADYIDALANPADWDNEQFFQHFLAVNRTAGAAQIQAHFQIDKTRGCPAVPQIARFHEIVLDLTLDFVLKEFGEDNLRKAGNWFIREKTKEGN